MIVRIDFHVHSERSYDGIMGYDRITELATERGIDAVAICDHDVVFDNEYVNESGVLLIPGTEISTEYGHLLCYFIDAPVETGTFEETVDAVHRMGGLAVLAHPYEHRKEIRDSVAGMVDGIEVWNSRADRKNRDANSKALDLAIRHNKLMFAGSDAHVEKEVGNGYVMLDTDELSCDGIREALMSGRYNIYGKESPAMCCSESQSTKLKNAHYGTVKKIYKRAKWALFTCKCFVHDIVNHRKIREDVSYVTDCKDR